MKVTDDETWSNDDVIYNSNGVILGKLVLHFSTLRKNIFVNFSNGYIWYWDLTRVVYYNNIVVGHELKKIAIDTTDLTSIINYDVQVKKRIKANLKFIETL